MKSGEKRRAERRKHKKELSEKLGRLIAAERKKIGLNQDDFAHEAGIHRSYIGFIERGQRTITVALLADVCRALGKPPSTLLKKLKL
ncbi:transcriptional regulator with XRE-family HTH domain [Ereboglobus sp. PH5-5]|nr:MULTISPECIES: helix-turn-helix transcriptional regulator [Ereboglobus]MDF9827510.1 transcriptional regulator with XRE-family HTH domain [Ereboglobus sp. PH5-10]MDF9828648.1 transcriptional regulator with XRE-family HTH domain [Ereboglobus sp. PH5-10]MDF9834420.1 transcriptional regulator with XRE-family HTH domain [Ereboglobus sp. PH5-5]